MQFHGNYCGPGWSGGRYTNSILSRVRPIDEFDNTCQRHDSAYARGEDINAADREFFNANIFGGGKRSIAALAVGANYLARGNIVPMAGSRFRAAGNQASSSGGTCAAPARNTTRSSNPRPKKKQKMINRPAMTLAASAPPTSLASVITPGQVTVTRSQDGATILTDFLLVKLPTVSVSSSIISAFGYISPYLLGNPSLATIAQTYESFKVNQFDLYYRGFQPTSQGGSMQLIVEKDPNTILPAVNTTTFYNRAFTGGNTLITPIWQPANLRCVVDNTWKTIDTYTVDDLKECTSGSYYCVQDGATVAAGYLLCRISMSFRGFRYNPRSLVAGSYLGPAESQTPTCSVANPTAGNLAILSGSGFTTGDIYRIIMQPQAASWTPPTGTNATNLFKVASGVAFTLTTATTLYGFATSGTTVQLYPTYYTACNNGGSTTQCILYATTGSSAGSFPGTLITKVSDTIEPSS